MDVRKIVRETICVLICLILPIVYIFIIGAFIYAILHTYKNEIGKCQYKYYNVKNHCMNVTVMYWEWSSNKNSSGGRIKYLYDNYSQAKARQFRCGFYPVKNPRDVLQQLANGGNNTFTCYTHKDFYRQVFKQSEDKKWYHHFEGLEMFTIGMAGLVFTWTFYCIWCELFFDRKKHVQISVFFKEKFHTRNLYEDCKQGDQKAIERKLKKKHIKTILNKVNSWGSIPLMVYLENRNDNISAETVKAMIEAGSDVTMTDIYGSYSCLYLTCLNLKMEETVHDKIVSILISSGAVSNREPVDNKSAMNELIQKNKLDLCCMLLEAGYPIRKDEIVYETLSILDEEKRPDFLWYEYENPAPLKRICRTIIRNAMNGVKVEEKLKNLPVPYSLLNVGVDQKDFSIPIPAYEFTRL